MKVILPVRPFLLGAMMWLPAAAAPAPPAVTATPHREALFEGFVHPPAAVRPFVRWWWNGNKVTAGEIRRELDVMKAAGIGGVEINSIKFPASHDPLGIPSLEWLGTEWCEMVRIAAEGARERAMTADIIVGSGWPFGGRFLPREHQTKILSVGRRKVTGPATVRLTEQEMFDGVDLTLHSKNEPIFKTVKFVRLTPAARDDFDPGVDLTRQFRGGVLEAEVLAGEHIVHYFVVQEGFQAVINGAPGSDGPVLNHFSRAATEFYLNHMSDGLKARLGEPAKYFRAFFCDSLELEGANWNEDMLAEFQRRRGYDLLPWLPYLLQKTGKMGDAVEAGDAVATGPVLEDKVQRVRYDYWTVLIELFRERFLEPYIQWCRSLGVQSRVQAYGHGYDPLESSMLVDIPECETWLNLHTGSPRQFGAQSINNKFTASGARLAGKSLVSCEEITDTNYVFFTPLEMIKIAGDESNLSGVTHSILHGFNYSPPNAEFPGWVRYGSYFNERNPWWPYMRRWTDYKARLSWLFQQAEPQANIAILHPLADLWKTWGMQRDPFPKKVHPAYAHRLWQAVHRNGHNCDYTSENILCRSTMENGAASFNTRRYDTIILMDVTTLRPDTAAALLRFAQSGGKVVFIGHAPSTAPGLRALGAQDQVVRETMEQLLSRHPTTCRIVPAPAEGEDLTAWFGKVRDDCGLVPDVAFGATDPKLSQTFHRAGDRDLFFVANSSREYALTVRARFRTAGRTPWVWDPETGTRHVHRWESAPNDLRLHLEPAESRVIVFEREAADAPAREPVASKDRPFEISGRWTIDLEHIDGARRAIVLPALRNLGEVDDLAGFAGQAVYRLRFTTDSAAEYRHLDLGVVREISEVTLNGRSLGARWYGRHLYTFPAPLPPGPNELVIRVTTIVGNHAKSLTGQETAQRWTKGLSPRPMGLLGPVRLLRAE